MKVTVKLRAVLLASVAGILPALGHAQTSAEGPALEEILVTAQKRSELLQDVPIQVDVLTSQALAARQVKMTSDIVSTIPNLSIERTDTYTNSVIVLRGLSQASGADAPVAVIVDGVPQNDPKQFNMHLFDISQIEVLKGPQGSLYGRNAEAGAIIITTTAPTNETHGFANLSFGRGSTVDASAGVSGAVVQDKVLFRLAGSVFRTDGVIPNTYRGIGADKVPYDWSLRGNILFKVSDAIDFTLIANHSEFKAGHVFFTPVFSGSTNDFQLPRGNFPNRGDGTSTNVTGKFDADLNFATLTAITGYTRLRQVQITDVDFTNPVESAARPTETFPFQLGDYQPYSDRIFSQEVRLVGPSAAPLRWLLSADYLHSALFINTHLFFDNGNAATDPTDPASTFRENPANNFRSSWGFSGQADYDVLENLTLTAGARYDTDRRKQENLANSQIRRATFDDFQPKVSLSYKIMPGKMVYASFGAGFRSGGFNPPSASVPVSNAEKLTNYELGFKTQWFDRLLTLNGAIFHSDVDNFQYSYIDFNSGSQITGNVDKVRIQGAELEATLNFSSDFEVYGKMGLTDPKIRKLALFPQYVGNVVPRGYKASFHTGFSYTHEVADATSVFLRAELEHTSKKYWFVDNLDVQKGKTYVNGSLGVKFDSFTATVWGKNIFNTRAYETYFPKQATGLPYDAAYPNRPATYGIELSTRF